MIRRTFNQLGVQGASQLALKNCMDLVPIMRWNHAHNIHVFRMTSDLFPWASEYRLEDLPDYDDICSALSYAGDISRQLGQRLSFHPGQFNVLASPDERVVQNSIGDLEHHAQIMDLMNLPRNHTNKINVHVGASYGDKVKALEQWCHNFDRLSDSVRTRLTLENDDKSSMYSVSDLYNMPYKWYGVPIVFDAHHHEVGANDGMSHYEALHMAASTWPANIRPVCHYSNSATLEDSTLQIRAHSKYLHKKFECHNLELDVIFEAKAKELAVLDYIKKFS